MKASSGRRRIRCRRRQIHLGCIRLIDHDPHSARRYTGRFHLHHGTRDTQTDASGGGHRIKHDRAIGPNLSNVTIAVVPMPIISTTVAEARHVFHQVTIHDLEFIEAFHFRLGVYDEGWPNDFREVSVRLVGSVKASEKSRKISDSWDSIRGVGDWRGTNAWLRSSTCGHDRRGSDNAKKHERMPSGQKLTGMSVQWKPPITLPRGPMLAD